MVVYRLRILYQIHRKCQGLFEIFQKSSVKGKRELFHTFETIDSPHDRYRIPKIIKVLMTTTALKTF
jgi:hypothetical protein